MYHNPTTTGRFPLPSATQAFQTRAASMRLQQRSTRDVKKLNKFLFVRIAGIPQQCYWAGTNLRRVVVPRSDRVFAYQARPRYGENRPQGRRRCSRFEGLQTASAAVAGDSSVLLCSSRFVLCSYLQSLVTGCAIVSCSFCFALCPWPSAALSLAPGRAF